MGISINTALARKMLQISIGVGTKYIGLREAFEKFLMEMKEIPKLVELKKEIAESYEKFDPEDINPVDFLKAYEELGFVSYDHENMRLEKQELKLQLQLHLPHFTKDLINKCLEMHDVEFALNLIRKMYYHFKTEIDKLRLKNILIKEAGMTEEQSDMYIKNVHPLTRRFDIGTHVEPEDICGVPATLAIHELTTTHTHVIGRSGSGKTKLLEIIARELIAAKCSLIVLDGKGKLYDNLIKFYIEYLGPKEENIFLIDPRDSYAPGLNLIAPTGDTDIDTQAGYVLDALKKMHRETEETKHWLEVWGRAVISTLSAAGLSITEVFPFTRADDLSFRHAVIEKAKKHTGLLERWKDFEGTFKKPKEQAEVLQAIRNRTDIFRRAPFLCGMFGQTESSINWQKIVNNGGTVFAQLGQGKADPKTFSFIGTAIIHQLVQAARMRGENNPRPCFVIMDEFQRFITPDISESLDELRSFGLHFILAHQHLMQLKVNDPRIFASVDTNAQNKFVFKVNREDAEYLYKELYLGEIFAGMQKVKEEVYRKRNVPYDDWIQTEIETEIEDDRGHKRRSTSRTSAPSKFYTEEEELAHRSYYNDAEVREELIDKIAKQKCRYFQFKTENEKAYSVKSRRVEDIPVHSNSIADFKSDIYNLTAHPIDKVYEEVERRPSIFLSENISKREDQGTDFDDPDTSQPKRKR